MKADSVESKEDALRAYFAQIKKSQLLTFEEELALSKRVLDGDDAARQILIEANLRLVVRIQEIHDPGCLPSRSHPGGQPGPD